MLKTTKMLTGVSYIFSGFMLLLIFIALLVRSIDVWFVTLLIGFGFIPCAIISGVVAFILSCLLKDKRAKYTLMIANSISLVIITIVTIGLIVVCH